MNLRQSNIPPHYDIASLGATQPAASVRHPQALTVHGTSLKSLFLLEQANRSHNLIAAEVIKLIVDNALRFQSVRGIWANYAREDGSLSILVKLNEQSRYEIVRIRSLTETVHLYVTPSTTLHARSYVSEQQRRSAVELARSQLEYAELIKYEVCNISKVPASFLLRERSISNVSDSQLRFEAREMYRRVQAIDDPDKVAERLEMLQWIHEDEEKLSSLVDLPQRNFKASIGGTTVGLMTVSVDMKNNDSMQEPYLGCSQKQIRNRCSLGLNQRAPLEMSTQPTAAKY